MIWALLWMTTASWAGVTPQTLDWSTTNPGVGDGCTPQEASTTIKASEVFTVGRPVWLRTLSGRIYVDSINEHCELGVEGAQSFLGQQVLQKWLYDPELRVRPEPSQWIRLVDELDALRPTEFLVDARGVEIGVTAKVKVQTRRDAAVVGYKFNIEYWDDYDDDGYVDAALGGIDCDDRDPSVNPEAVEIWYDGTDQNCDGQSDYDQDGDGFDALDYTEDAQDCDDLNPEVSPDAEEVWYDGVDQDCSGGSDYDQDRDGFDSQEAAEGGLDCDDLNPEVGPTSDEIWYDGIDQDCSGGSDYDQDRDGFDSRDHLPDGLDCDDEDPSIPNAEPAIPLVCQVATTTWACNTSGSAPGGWWIALVLFGVRRRRGSTP